MALARLNVPGVLLYGGSILPGRYKGQDVTIGDVFEAVGAHAAGKITEDELHELEEAASPGIGACGGQFTANTMAMAFEVLGLSPMGSAMVPAAYEDKNRVATEAGALIMDVLARGQRPRDIITREGLENAIAAIATSGGSTNGVLHLLALAREAGVELDIDDFDRIAAQTPTTCDLKPGGRFVAKDLYEAGGIAVVAKRLLDAGLLHEDAQTVTGQDDRRARARGGGDARPGGRPPARRPGQEDRRPGDPARQPRAGGLRGQAVRPRARPPPRPGARVRVRGGRDGGRHRRLDRRRRRRRDPQRGPGRRPRHARDARRHGGARGGGARRATSRCSPTAASPAPRAASWPATSRPRRCVGGPIAAVQDGDTITIDVANRRMDVELADDEIARRVEAYRSPPPAYADGVLAKYARLVLERAREGAVTRP